MQDIAEFLGKHDPFVGLDEAALERLAARTEIEYFEAGADDLPPGRGAARRDVGRPHRSGRAAGPGARARPARRGRAVRPPVDALGASDRLGGARAGELALLSARGRRRDPAARATRRACGPWPGALLDRPRPGGAPSSASGPRRRSGDGEEPASKAAGGLRAERHAARGRRPHGGRRGELDPRRSRRRRARDRHRPRPALEGGRGRAFPGDQRRRGDERACLHRAAPSRRAPS